MRLSHHLIPHYLIIWVLRFPLVNQCRPDCGTSKILLPYSKSPNSLQGLSSLNILCSTYGLFILRDTFYGESVILSFIDCCILWTLRPQSKDTVFPTVHALCLGGRILLEVKDLIFFQIIFLQTLVQVFCTSALKICNDRIFNDLQAGRQVGRQLSLPEGSFNRWYTNLKEC